MQVLWFGAGPSGGLQVTSGLVLGLYGVSTVELLLLKGRRVQFSSLVFLPAGSLFLLLPLVLGIGGSSSLGFLRSVECKLVRSIRSGGYGWQIARKKVSLKAIIKEK